ncbi:hypothetical protein D9756_011632 [Leucocoprinus leucothites]|uniref:DUF6535 domain-containing protein n=1 Tax=Leucocoprinus leucothites TaxID=201217 RepID=A0A8H5FNM6_9AGAR|nr:hypothetical protein D9756_011632 [Leucoagaricus leucothites]
MSHKAGARQLSRLFNIKSQKQEQETGDPAKQDQSWDSAQQAKGSDQQSPTDNNNSGPGQPEKGTKQKHASDDRKNGIESKEDKVEPPKDHWKYCYEAIDKRDEEFCKRLQDEVNALLVIASLLLGVITAFNRIVQMVARRPQRVVTGTPSSNCRAVK